MESDSDSNNPQELRDSIASIVDNLAVDSEGEEEEDPVVEELPVYLSSGLDCYLLQYPVRPSSMTYDSAAMKKLLFRPKNQQIEMHLSLDTENENYDASRGEQIAINVDGESGGRNSNSTFTSGRMDTQVLSGGRAVSDTKRYAVGIFNNNELHLTQVKGVLTVRPNLSYLDKSDRRAKQEGRSQDPDDVEENAQPEAVTVKFSKGESDRSAKWKEKSYQSLVSKTEEEAWVSMRFNQLKSVKWDDESQNLFCENMEKKIEFELPSDKYLQSLK